MPSQEVIVDVSQDWAIACDVQERFMQNPTAPPQTLAYGARCCQMRALGGDCYDFFPLPDNRIALVVGDASGRGLAAALMISNVQSSLRTAISFATDDPAAVLAAVNRQVHASSFADRYATLFYGVFDQTTRTLQYVNAGHNRPFIIRNGRPIAQLDAGGPPVGIFADSKYETGKLDLCPGDLTVAYTDGVVEAANAAGKEWGTDGLLEAILRNHADEPHEIVEAVFAALESFTCGHQTDDATVLVARI